MKLLRFGKPKRQMRNTEKKFWMGLGQMQKKYLSELSQKLDLEKFIRRQQHEILKRYNRSVFFLIKNACGELSAHWLSQDDLFKMLETHELIGEHRSSGYPILERK